MHIKLILKTLNFAFATLLILAACAFAYIALPSFGNRALIVRSGSMKPAIGVGDLVVVRINKDIKSPVNSTIPKYKAGEIVAFKAGGGKTLVTHRIASVKVESGKVLYETKGDANKTADKGIVPEENIIGRKFVSLPGVGRIVSFTKSNIGFPLLVIFPATLVILLEIIAIFKEFKRQRGILQSQLSSRASFTSLKVLLPIFATIFVFQSAFAFFSDSETSTSNIFNAADSFASPSPSPSPTPSPSPSPTPPPIAQTLVVNEFLWNSSCTPNPATKFFIELYNGSGSQINLKDWRFRDGSGNTIQISNSNSFINSGAYVLITKSNSTFTNCYTNQGGVAVLNLGGNPDFTPSATGGVIRLEMPNGSGGFIVVDRVEYGPTLNSGTLNTASDQSIARSPNGVDSALGDTFAVSDFAVDATISPGVAN